MEKEILTTSSGLNFYFDNKWTTNENIKRYDRTIAKCHIANYGKIICYENGNIIDDEYELEEIENEFIL